MNNPKMRVWWCPQVGIKNCFYIPVSSPEEAKKIMDILAAYDCFEYNNHVKFDYCNCGGLEVFDEEVQEWNDWCYEDDKHYFDNVEEYCEDFSPHGADLEKIRDELFSQVEFD